MDKQDIYNLEKMLDLFNEMYFKDLSGKDLIDKMIIFKNFATTVNKLKDTKLKPVKKKKPIRKIKEEGKE